jgi:hypothetical protein
MKIDKVIFPTSIEYSDFWNINSQIFKKCLNIEPLCLLFGKKEETNVSEEYGSVMEMEFIEELPKMVQLALWKFHYTQREPEVTWMIGDIDQIPLQKHAFIGALEEVPDDHYVHLCQDESSENSSPDPEFWKKGYRSDGSANLPAHYHVAKGKTFKEFLELSPPFEEWAWNMVNQRLEEMGINQLSDIPNLDFENRDYFWAYEETYTTNFIRNNLHKERFTGFCRPFRDKICRSNGSRYNSDKLKDNLYVDIHCPRPYKEHVDPINTILKLAWKDDFNEKNTD